MLMMVFSLRFITLLRGGDETRIGKVCCLIAAASAIVLLSLQICGILELHEVVVWYGAGMVSLHLVALLGQKPNKSEILWLLPSSLALGSDLVIFLHTGSIATAPIFLIWIIINLFVSGFGFLHVAVRQEHELEMKDEELRGAKMQALINQIQPHIIYNTLATIHMICAEDPKRAMRAIEDFSDFLHANFVALAATEPILFKQELEHTKAYLNVEIARCAEKLSVDYYTDFIAFSLPPLTLQPIVENSIKHGLKNVRERLDIMCSGTLDIVPRPGGGTIVTVFVPIKS